MRSVYDKLTTIHFCSSAKSRHSVDARSMIGNIPLHNKTRSRASDFFYFVQSKADVYFFFPPMADVKENSVNPTGMM